MRLSDAELVEMRDGCKGVTPGPYISYTVPGSASIGPDAGMLIGPRQVWRDKTVLHTPENAAHFSRLSPERVSALVTELLELRAAMAEVIAADDDFRASMSPKVEKDPLTLACDRARKALQEPT